MEKIMPILGEINLPENCNILAFEVLESTNKTAKEFALSGEKEGTVILALSQTGGKGRGDRKFFSPQKSGVYFSLILKPQISAEKTVLITTAAAVAVSRAIESLSDKKAGIKWVNDIFVGGKKVSGILTESAFSGDGKCPCFVVLGIGINLFTPKGGYPEDIKNIAGSIFGDYKEGLREALLSAVLSEFFRIYENFENCDFIKEYENRLILMGKEISYLKNGESFTATVTGIDNLCGLKVRTSDGRDDVISSGEVSLRSKNFAE